MKWDEGTIHQNTHARNDGEPTDQKEPGHFKGLFAIRYFALA